MKCLVETKTYGVISARHPSPTEDSFRTDGQQRGWRIIELLCSRIVNENAPDKPASEVI